MCVQLVYKYMASSHVTAIEMTLKLLKIREKLVNPSVEYFQTREDTITKMFSMMKQEVIVVSTKSEFLLFGQFELSADLLEGDLRYVIKRISAKIASKSVDFRPKLMK